VIMRDCHFEDPAAISIGAGVTIGPGCHFLILVSPTSSGPHDLYSTGAIQIGDDCKIGGNVTILPFRTVGMGATVIAGSMVQKVTFSVLIPDWDGMLMPMICRT